MPASADVVLFAIRSAIRVNEQVRRGFAGMVSAEEIHLPLPSFPSSPSVETARTYYEADGAQYLEGDAKLRTLFDRWQQLGEAEALEFVRCYQEHWALDAANAAPAGSVLAADLTWDDYRALLTVRQWQRGGDKSPSLLQRAAGTLIEIAVDYHLQVPGAVNTASPNGKLVKAFLEAIDEVQFAEGSQHMLGTRLVDALFVSVLETLRDHPELAADSERGRLLVKTVAGDLTGKAQKLIEAAPDQLARDRVQDFAATLFPSLLTSAAATVVADPRRFIGLGRQAQVDLISGVGTAILGSLQDRKLGLETLFSRETLEAAVRAVLVAAARHPQLLGAKGEGAGKLVAAVAKELGDDANVIGPGLLPELVRLVLEKGAENLDILLPDKNQPERHLLARALKAVLPVLAAKPPAGAKWKPALRSEDALALAEALLDEVVRNPQWVTDEAAAKSPRLGEVVGAVLAALRNEAGPRLRRESAVAILAAAVEAVGRRLELGVKDAQGRHVVAAVVGAIVKTVHGDGAALEAAWLFAREEALQRLTQLILDEIAQAGEPAKLLGRVQAFLDEAVERIRKGTPWWWDELAPLLREHLAKGG